MSELINVNPNSDDAFYRYKMPKIISKVEGKGNGIKTVIPNIQEVAKALHRRSDYITKYFGFELGSQTIVGDRDIVNGSHEAARLQTILSQFIKKFVLCSKCDNPETDIIIEGTKKKQLIFLTCVACGHKDIVDMSHKLVTYIIRHPPDTENKEIYDDEEVDEIDQGMGDIDIKDIAVKVKSESEDDDNWTTSRRVDMSTNMSSWLQVQDPVKSFCEQVGKQDTAKLLKQLDIERKDAIIGAVTTLLNDTSFIEKELIKKHEAIWRVLLTKKKKLSKNYQKYLILAIEILVSNTNPKLMSNVSGFLLEFYDLGFIEETIIKKWFGHPSKKFAGSLEKSQKVREHSKRFMEFLDDNHGSESEDGTCSSE